MATNLISAKVSAEKNIFQEMREDLNQKFSELASLVNQRKLDLDRKIDDLELEYNNKQIEKDKQIMKELREMTEQKIDQNTLMDVRNSIIKEISDKIQKLEAESKSQLKLTLTLNWNFANIKQEIDRIDLKLAIPNEPHISSPFRADPTGFEANFNPSIRYQIPVPHHSGDTMELGDENDSYMDGSEDDSHMSGDGSGDESEEELPIIEGQEVELVKGASEPPAQADGANHANAGSYLLRGKDGRVLKLAISESAISEIHNECLSLFHSDRLPHIRASDLEVISDTESELTVHASVVGVSASYLARKYSEEEVAALSKAGSLSSHLLAVEKDWCVIEVEGFPTLFGSRDLML